MQHHNIKTFICVRGTGGEKWARSLLKDFLVTYRNIGVWPGFGLFQVKCEGTERNWSPGRSFFKVCWDPEQSSAAVSRDDDKLPCSSGQISIFPDKVAVWSSEVFLVLRGISVSVQHWNGERPEFRPCTLWMEVFSHVSSVMLPLGEWPGDGVGEWWGDREPA